MAQLRKFNSFDFDDVRLVPKKAIVETRSIINTKAALGDREFEIPAIPANMSSIIDEKLAIHLAENNHFYVMHRFDVDSLYFTQMMHSKGLFASISLGIQQKDYDTVDIFKDLGTAPEYITVDVAHGHSESVLKIVRYISHHLPNTFLIAGNVATPEGANELAKAGANAVKVGIGPGCFAAGMKVETITGLKNIEDIEIDDLVRTHSGSFEKVTNTFINEEPLELIEINGIKCTPSHEFYVCLKSDIEKITSTNYEDFCFWVEARDLDIKTQSLIRLSDDS